MAPEVADTADFLLLMDKLFDSVNGAARTAKKGKLLRCAVTQNSQHKEVWKQSIKMLRSVRFLCPRTMTLKKVPSVENWIKTLNGFLYLREKLLREGIKYIIPRNFNQDPLENFFGMIRSHGCRNINPTCTSFMTSFKSSLLSNFVSSHSVGANCEKDDSDGALDTLKSFVVNNVPLDECDDVPEHIFPDSETIDTNNSAMGSSETKKYVGGYIVKKIKQLTKNCNDCKNIINSSDATDIVSVREYSRGILNRPNTNFQNFFNSVIDIFEKNISKYCYKFNVKDNVIRCIPQHIIDSYSCKAHVRIALTVIVEFMIYAWTNNINKILHGKIKNNSKDPIKQLADKYYQQHKKNVNNRPGARV